MNIAMFQRSLLCALAVFSFPKNVMVYECQFLIGYRGNKNGSVRVVVGCYVSLRPVCLVELLASRRDSESTL